MNCVTILDGTNYMTEEAVAVNMELNSVKGHDHRPSRWITSLRVG